MGEDRTEAYIQNRKKDRGGHTKQREEMGVRVGGLRQKEKKECQFADERLGSQKAI